MTIFMEYKTQGWSVPMGIQKFWRHGSGWTTDTTDNTCTMKVSYVNKKRGIWSYALLQLTFNPFLLLLKQGIVLRETHLQAALM